MGTIIGLLLILLLMAYPPYMLIKWAIYGKGLFFPNFNRIDKKVNENLRFKVNLNSWYGKLNYYFLLLWTLGEIVFIVFLFAK